MRAGHLNKRVSLSRSPQTSPDSDGFFEDLNPREVWAAIEPLSPAAGQSRSIEHVVTMRYHPQVTLDTRIVYGTRELFVRGVQNVNEHNVELRLLCEEIQP